MIHSVRNSSSALGRPLVVGPFTALLVAGLSFGAVACGGDDDDVEASDTNDNGGSGASGGTSARGGSGTGGTAGRTGGTGGATGGSAGKASLVDPDQYDGQEVFRYDTFGDEQLWTGTLKMHQAIQAALDPTTALSLGLKVDADALPAGILDDADLTSPATTIALIGLDAVVGIKGTVDANGNLTSVGITCALCHSDVDDSVMEGIGSRIDGAANRDLDPGAIIALAPGLEGATDKLEVYQSWGPGMYDPRYNQDGVNHPVLIPPIYGLADVPYETYTGDGPISYWNAYVGITQMGGIGNFYDPRIDVAVFYDDDRITAKLPALHEYQVSLEAPAPDSDAFDAEAAERGDALFDGAAGCGTCHSGPAHSDAGQAWHAPEETGMEPMTAERSASGLYRTTPLRALLAHPPYFHDGSAETLADVVTHYNTELDLGLSSAQQADVVEYLKSL